MGNWETEFDRGLSHWGGRRRSPPAPSTVFGGDHHDDLGTQSFGGLVKCPQGCHGDRRIP